MMIQCQESDAGTEKLIGDVAFALEVDRCSNLLIEAGFLLARINVMRLKDKATAAMWLCQFKKIIREIYDF